MVYTVIGVLFVMLFGIDIGYQVLWLGDGGGWQEVEALQGSPVKFNLSGHIIPVTEVEYSEIGIAPAKHDLPVGELNDPVVYRCVVFMAVISICKFQILNFIKIWHNFKLLKATFVALGALTVWHYKLISRGETSVESHINKSETKRLDALGKTYANPYNFGKSNNWKLFLGLTRGR